jgi:hypothetical protein
MVDEIKYKPLNSFSDKDDVSDPVPEDPFVIDPRLKEKDSIEIKF